MISNASVQSKGAISEQHQKNHSFSFGGQKTSGCHVKCTYSNLTEDVLIRADVRFRSRCISNCNYSHFKTESSTRVNLFTVVSLKRSATLTRLHSENASFTATFLIRRNKLIPDVDKDVFYIISVNPGNELPTNLNSFFTLTQKPRGCFSLQ